MHQAERVVVISDVHGNAPALAAVLEEAMDSDPDLYVFGGDLTWGSLPEETYELVAPLEQRSMFVRGNADRRLLECCSAVAAGEDDGLTPREHWMVTAHSDKTRDLLGRFHATVAVDIHGLGVTCFCHGSPRSDEDLITPETPPARIRELTSDVDASVVVSAHTHVQFDRAVAGIRSVNAGSVGMAYHGPDRRAYWAVLGPDVDLRQTEYDVEATAFLYRESGDPLAERMVEMLFDPPTLDEVIADAETRKSAD